jgi:hypothetical protein
VGVGDEVPDVSGDGGEGGAAEDGFIGEAGGAFLEVVDDEDGGAGADGEVMEYAEERADLSIVAEVGGAEECDDGVENDELAATMFIEGLVEGVVSLEAEEVFGVGGEFGSGVGRVEDVDVAEISAVGFETWADDLLCIVFARDEDDGAFVFRRNTGSKRCCVLRLRLRSFAEYRPSPSGLRSVLRLWLRRFAEYRPSPSGLRG